MASPDYHVEFLRMLGWDGEELERLLPEWRHAAAFLNLSDEDVRYAVETWIPKYWNMKLEGVRKLIAACIWETVEISKAEEYKKQGKKIVYSNTTASHACIYANRLAGKGELHVFYPEFMVGTVKNAFFGKGTTAADASCLSQSCQHCALNKIRAGMCGEGEITAPTVTWNWGLHCNEAPKTEELVNCMYGDQWQDVFITIPHDAPLGCDEAGDEYRVAYLAAQIRQGQQQVSELTGIPVTEKDMRDALDCYMGYMERLEILTDLVVNADPQPISGNELTLFALCQQVCFDTGLDRINDALDTMIVEVRDMIRKGEGILPKGAPKIACHFQPLNFPWIDKAFQENGVALSLGRLFPPASWLKQCIDDDDVYYIVAHHCLMCPNAVNMLTEAQIDIKILSRYSFDGALFGFFSHDRWIGALHKTMIKEVEEKTGIPHYYLEGEFWNEGKYSMEDRMPFIRGICNSLKIAKL